MKEEEALKPDAIDDYRELRLRSPVPISGGEVLTRRQAFEPWLSRGALDIVQPDVTKCGGISEVRRIAWTARENGVRMIPHGWNTAVGLATDLQLAIPERPGIGIDLDPKALERYADAELLRT